MLLVAAGAPPGAGGSAHRGRRLRTGAGGPTAVFLSQTVPQQDVSTTAGTPEPRAANLTFT
jgi:hypothetical protein